MNGLNEQLNKLYEKSDLPKDACDTTIKWMENLPLEKVIKEGSTIPDANLMDEEGNIVNLGECLKKHNLVLSFNLGGWCPYCNTEKKELSKLDEEIEKLGAKMLHISPELREYICKCKKELGIKFKCLSDEQGKLARSLGILFEIDDKKVVDAFQRTGLDFEKYYGKGNFFYVIPATIIVNKRGKIVRIFASKDHRKRMEPSEIINCLKQCSDVESS